MNQNPRRFYQIERADHVLITLCLVAFMAFFPVLHVNATTEQVFGTNVQHGAILHPGIDGSRTDSQLQADSPTPTSTPTSAPTASPTTEPTSEPAAAPPIQDIDSETEEDAFAAWNSRAPVTRQENYPVHLSIPAIEVETFVEQLGERADGSMATPTDPDNVAWYSYGAIPGENGNVVVAGHLDRVGGAPAVFWDLDQLSVGDAVIMIDNLGTEYHYEVTEQTSYPYNDAPIDEIFGFDLVSRLNLITCRGSWDRNQQTYTERLVVYTKLIEIVEK